MRNIQTHNCGQPVSVFLLWNCGHFFEPVRYRVDLIYFPQINLNFLLFRCESEIKVFNDCWRWNVKSTWIFNHVKYNSRNSFKTCPLQKRLFSEKFGTRFQTRTTWKSPFKAAQGLAFVIASVEFTACDMKRFSWLTFKCKTFCYFYNKFTTKNNKTRSNSSC